MILNNLPLVHSGGTRTYSWGGKLFGRNFPLKKLSDARGAIVLEYKNIEIALFGQVKAFVLENPDKFVERLRAVIRRAFGALDEQIPIASTMSGNKDANQHSASTFMLAGLLPWFQDVKLEEVRMYTARCGYQVRHGIIMHYDQFGTTFKRGYVSCSVLPNYDFAAWKKATVESYSKYSEADGYPKMLRVVNNAEAVFKKSSAPKADFMIIDDLVLPSTTVFGNPSIQKSDTSDRILHAHIDLCEGHAYLYAPMVIPVGSDRTSSNAGGGGQPPRASLPSSPPEAGKYNEYRTLLAFELDGNKRLTADMYLHNHKGGRFAIPNVYSKPDPMMLQFLRTMLPDLLLIDSHTPLAVADLSEWHKNKIALKYRDADSALDIPNGLTGEASSEYFNKQFGAVNNLRNLVSLPELVGNTLALYSYIAGEAMGDYQTWHTGEFLDLLDDAFATWQPTKNASAVEAINAICATLGCPRVKYTKYEFTDTKVF